MPLSKSYRVHEFAERTGLTVKALYHYDRLGLLNPRRTASGYRLYSDRNVERAEQIAALKFLGISLRQIKAVLDRTGLPLLKPSGGSASRSRKNTAPWPAPSAPYRTP